MRYSFRRQAGCEEKVRERDEIRPLVSQRFVLSGVGEKHTTPSPFVFERRVEGNVYIFTINMTHFHNKLDDERNAHKKKPRSMKHARARALT